jgi:Icc-related predicted phosphoesterase
VLLHYAPIEETVKGEPEQILPFLGNDRLVEPIDRFKAEVAFHGHAHHGTFAGKTPGGIPVFNVSHVLLKAANAGEMYFLYDINVPEEGMLSEEADATPMGAGAVASAGD